MNFLSHILENITHMLTKRTFIFVLAALCVLFIPFFAMQFQVEGWDWKAPDYIIIAVLLTGVGFALAAATNREFSLSRRVIAIACAGLIFVLYVHLAVGIVDSWPLAGS